MFFKIKVFEKKRHFKAMLLSAALLLSAGCSNHSSEDLISRNSESDYMRDEIVQRNMANVQIAAEHYCADHEPDKFPTKLDDAFLTYLPGGTENKVPSSTGQPNPFTGKLEFPIVIKAGSKEFPELPVIRTPDDVRQLRDGKRFKIGQGVIVYFALENAAGYAIVGGAHDCYSLMDHLNDGKVLVFSNID